MKAVVQQLNAVGICAEGCRCSRCREVVADDHMSIVSPLPEGNKAGSSSAQAVVPGLGRDIPMI